MKEYMHATDVILTKMVGNLIKTFTMPLMSHISHLRKDFLIFLHLLGVAWKNQLLSSVALSLALYCAFKSYWKIGHNSWVIDIFSNIEFLVVEFGTPQPE